MKLPDTSESLPNHTGKKFAPELNKQYRRPTSKQVESRPKSSRLGLPRFKWTLPLLGLSIYTFAIISFKFPVAQLGIAIGVLGLLMSPKPVRMPAPFKLFMAFVIWALVSAITSSYTEIALEAVLERFKMLVVMILVMNAFQDAEQLRFYLLLIVGCFIFFPARGTFIGGDNVAGRVVWTHIYSNPNDLAALCFLAYGIALSLVFSETKWTPVRLGAAVSAAILLVVILRTQSRGVFLAITVSMGPAFIVILVKQLRLAIGVGIVVALLLSFAIPPKVWDRLSGIARVASADSIGNLANSQDSADTSSAERFEILKVGWRIFLDNPVVGVGLGTYRVTNNLYAPELGKRDTHNTYVNLAAETGLPGVTLWCMMVASFLGHAFRTRRKSKESMLKAQHYWIRQTIIGLLVSGFFGTYSGLSFPYIMLSLLWCMTEMIAKESQVQLRHAAGSRSA